MDDRQIEAWADAQCALLGMSLDPAHRPGVLRYLKLVADLAPRVMDFGLGPADEQAPAFVPVAPAAPAAPPDAAGEAS